MKKEFTNENFERFLKESADSFRLKAPDKVWQHISKELNGRRRRFIIALSVFLLVSSAVGYYTISNLSTGADASSKQTNKQPIPTVKENPAQPGSTALTTPATTAIQTTFQKPASISQRSVSIKQAVNQNPGTESFHQIAGGLPDPLAAQNNFTPTVVDSYTEFDQQQTTDKEDDKSNLTMPSSLPLTIESVVNSYRLKIKKARIEKQFYFAPTISYRKLTENKSYLRSLDAAAIPSNYPALYSSVNNNVTHKPDVGFELGYTLKYPVSNKLKVRGGLQFNVNRYDVKAFSSPLSIATIALNNGGSRVDSLNTISGYSNVNGYKSNWLQNFSFQVSAPVGVEYLLSKNDKIEVGVATTFQPTYVLGDRAYLISTDYKSYTQVPWLVRRWNVNTAFETFVVYNTGKTKWQVGPQVRYQLLSSFISKYPVKENLFDFGLKLGISLNQ